MTNAEPLTTPDGRYLIVRGRLWRRANPVLSEEERQTLVRQLIGPRAPVRATGPSSIATPAAARWVSTASIGVAARKHRSALPEVGGC